MLRDSLAAILLIGAQPLLAQTGDPAAGARQFAQCRTCHATVATGPDGLGPNLVGIYGKKAATTRKKFAYSLALRKSNLTWDDATLDRWITDPAATVKGTKMVFIGIARKPVRQNIIAYLKTLK